MSLTGFIKRIRYAKELQMIEYLEAVKHIITKAQETGVTTLKELLEVIDDIIQENKKLI